VTRALRFMAFLAVARAVAAAEPELRAVRLTMLDYRPALRLLVDPALPAGEVVREGDFVLIRVKGAAADPLPLPKVDSPLEEITLVREADQSVVKVKIAPEVPFEASHEPGMLTVVFGELPAPELRGPVTPELYAQLFPAGATEAATSQEPPKATGSTEGIAIGRLSLRPYVSASYVDADVLAFASPIPVRDRYLQIAPGVTVSMPIARGELAADYEPRLRFFSTIPEVGETSHFASARLDVPIGSRTQLQLTHHYTRATLETTVVDPGREYFFGLERYTYNESRALVRVDVGARLWAEGEGSFAWNRFDDPQQAGFIDYDHRALRAGLGYDIASDLRATVSYSYDRLPPSPERELVDSSAHSVLATLAGEIAALTQATLTAGFRRQQNPLASGESRSYDGLTLGGSLRRELGRATSLELQLNRNAEPSAYDTNAYYVNNAAALSLTAPLPLGGWLRGGVGFLRNQYPNPAPGLSEPRRDDVLGWSLGVGRSLGWRAFVRADYRRDRRQSNVPGYDVTTSGFAVQLGVGLFGPGPSR